MQNIKAKINKKKRINKKYFTIIGTVISGLGHGKYYLNYSNYNRQITKILHKKPYPGTLNLKINNYYNEKLILNLKKSKNYNIDGFYKDNKYYGGATYFPCFIKKIYAIFLIPEFTSHKLNLLELVTTYNLRKKLSLSNGNNIKITINY